MKVLVDENIARKVSDRLRDAGHEVRFVRDISLGLPDSEVLGLSDVGELLVTEDKGFGQLCHHRRWAGGVLLVRLEGFTNDRKAEFVSALLKTVGDGLLGSFTVLRPTGARRRRWTHL